LLISIEFTDFPLYWYACEWSFQGKNYNMLSWQRLMVSWWCLKIACFKLSLQQQKRSNDKKCYPDNMMRISWLSRCLVTLS
jgi:hypothetical protein